MNVKKYVLVLVAAIALSASITPHEALAEELSVKKNDATCLQTATPPCFGSIGDAVTYVNNIVSSTTGTATTYSIQVEAGTYDERITLGAGISSLKGRETARTILNGYGSGTLITITGGSPVISNLAFKNAPVGIQINNATATSSTTIKNNIFNLGLGGTAVQVTQSAAQPSITNNTFHLNNTAINSLVNCTVQNNIFSSNTIALTPLSSFVLTSVTNNDFYPASTTESSVIGTSNISSNPDFVDDANGDFHLLEGSLCINTSGDMGAYGTGTDNIPFQVAGVTAEQDPATAIVSVNWDPNLDYKVIGYRVYYGRNSGGPYDGTGAAEGNSPISLLTSTTVSATLSNLSTTVNTPASPVLEQPSPRNERLILNWSAVDGATGHRIYYGELSPSVLAAEVGNTTTYTLSDLTNGTRYFVAVSAITQAKYYIAVSAVYSGATNTNTAGTSNESIYSAEAAVGSGEIKESALSNTWVEYPEAAVPYPNLSNSGPKCFIATAAYGNYAAPEVLALREFRDRYLLTNEAGRAFVRWYYEHGPVAAAYLDAHPGYKPAVRAALIPAVGAALFMTRTSLLMKALVSLFMLIIGLTAAYRFSGKRVSRSGGAAIKTVTALVLALVFPWAASAEDPSIDRARWSVEIKGGMFTPSLDNWSQSYGSNTMPVFEGTLAYKILRQVEVGMGAGRAWDKGRAYAPEHGIAAGEVTHELYPLNVFVVARGVVSDNQWLVPYIGGGWTRIYYRQKTEDQDKVRGSADGYHVRGGLQFSLNVLDERAANNMFKDYGIYQTYLFIEAEQTKAKVKVGSFDLGGTSYLAGLLFEF